MSKQPGRGHSSTSSLQNENSDPGDTNHVRGALGDVNNKNMQVSTLTEGTMVRPALGDITKLPQQDNSFDCGLFLLHYVERFLMDAPSSFNPLKIDVFSTFLSDNWFVPAEASLKRSLIRKLIHQLVTDPSQDFPILTCAKEQFDERHQISENAEQEAAVEFLAQGCSAGESDSVCRIPGTQQESTSICFNDPGKGLPVSGFVLETAEVSMFAVQDMQVCPPDNDSAVCLPIQVVKDDMTFADSDNQSGLRLCAPEGVEALKDDGCLVKDRDTHNESVVDYLHNNQKISSQAEAKVHDTMDSEVMALQTTYFRNEQK